MYIGTGGKWNVKLLTGDEKVMALINDMILAP